MMRQKRLGCVYMQDISDLVGYWLIKGVCLEVRMLRNFWKVEVVTVTASVTGFCRMTNGFQRK